jgi:hypothetical protein
MPDDHSEVEPPLPIPNRTVKRLSADDSEPALVKVGHRQAVIDAKSPKQTLGAFCFCALAFAFDRLG